MPAPENFSLDDCPFDIDPRKVRRRHRKLTFRDIKPGKMYMSKSERELRRVLTIEENRSGVQLEEGRSGSDRVNFLILLDWVGIPAPVTYTLPLVRFVKWALREIAGGQGADGGP